MNMRKVKQFFGIAAILICSMLLSLSVVYADTDGTELQVEQPMQLEIQLGSAWAGVEFQLKTDAGLYPGTLVVGDDGVLRTELGGSTNYILSSLNSTVAAPSPDETQAPATTEPTSETDSQPETSLEADNTAIPEKSEETVIGGIPVKHMILFGGGLLLAVGCLVAIAIAKKRRTSNSSWDEGDDEEDD